MNLLKKKPKVKEPERETVDIPEEEEVISEEELNGNEKIEKPVEKSKEEVKEEVEEEIEEPEKEEELTNDIIKAYLVNLDNRITNIESVLFRMKGAI